MGTGAERAIQNEIQAAAQAGELALLYLRKGFGRPKDVGELARFAATFACRALYWQSEQSRRDSIECTVLSQARLYDKDDKALYFGKTEKQIEREKFEREFFNRKQWEWFNSAGE